MDEKFRVVRLKENPTRKRRTRRKRKGARRQLSRPTRRRRIVARSRPKKSTPRGFLVEGMKQSGRHVAFVYWTGRTFSRARRAAKIFRTEKEANKACRASMKRRAASYRLARVVPA